MSFTIKFVQSIDEVSRAELNTLSDSPFFSFEWFKAVEEADSLPATPSHIAVYSGNKLAAFLPCYKMRGSEFLPFSNTFGRLAFLFRLAGFQDKKYFSVFSPYCFNSSFLVKKSFSRESKELLYLALDVLEKKAAKNKEFVVFPYVVESDNWLQGRLTKRGFFTTGKIACAEIDCLASSFEEFLLSLSQRRRENVRKQLRRNRKNGVEVLCRKSFQDNKLLAELADKTFMKHNNCRGPFTEPFFSSIQKYLRDKVLFFVGKKEDRILCFSLCIAGKTELTSLLSGVDYPLPPNQFAFFESTYYSPLSHCFTSSYNRFNLLAGDIETKKLRGAKIVQRKIMLCSGNVFKDFFLKAVLRIFSLFASFRQ